MEWEGVEVYRREEKRVREKEERKGLETNEGGEERVSTEGEEQYEEGED